MSRIERGHLQLRIAFAAQPLKFLFIQVPRSRLVGSFTTALLLQYDSRQ